MTTYNAQNMTWLQKFTVGDIITNKETGYPHLDEVGDIGWLANRETGEQVAKFVTIKIYPNPKTNEVLTKDIQIVETFNPKECFPNPTAKCAIHGNRFPCSDCTQLEHDNYRC